jgi:serine/threonine protein kinase/Tol biopolymer transport system component
LGPYEILSPLGAGGMGEVYRARDTRLGRDVAIKVLPEEFAKNTERLRRFEGEARAASALSDPHIVTVFDVGEALGVHYFASELVEGSDLRNLIDSGGLPVRRVLELAEQIASGLAAAHEKGIVHRDLKPENVLLTKAGQAKIADFGLAKLVEQGGARVSQLPTSDGHQTAAGVVMGTVAYMSPEQVRGMPVDHRSDIFSFGTVLYEMTAGRPAFRRETAAETMTAILKEEPTQLGEADGSVPPALAAVIVHCLAKTPERRFQSARDLAFALVTAERTGRSGAVSSAAPRRRFSVIGHRLGVAALVAAGVLAGYLLRPRPAAGPLPDWSDLTSTLMTTDPGYEGEPTFSPDGRTIAYVADRDGNFEIYLQQISGGPAINLTKNPGADIQPAFSPDGREIAFVSDRSSRSEVFHAAPRLPLVGGDVWVMPAFGGPARKIVADGNFPSWTPDGTALLYVHGTFRNARIARIPSDGGEARDIPITEAQVFRYFSPHLSADGRWLLYQNGGQIEVVAAEGGKPHIVARGEAPSWGAGSTTILYTNNAPGKARTLWVAPFSKAKGEFSGPPRPLTFGRGGDVGAVASPDGSAIAFAALDDSLNLEELPLDAESGRVSGPPVPLTVGDNEISFFDPSPDGRKVVYNQTRSARSHIWSIDPPGAPIELTRDPGFSDGDPEFSPDGSEIAFSRSAVGESETTWTLWLMKPDGTHPRRVAPYSGDIGWLPGGKALIQQDGKLLRLDLASGATERVAGMKAGTGFALMNVDSAGRWIAYQSSDGGKVRLMAVPTSGGEPRLIPTEPYEAYHPSFSPSGRWLYFQPGHKNVYRVPGPAQGWKSAPPEKVTDFSGFDLYIENPRISRDGKKLFYTRGRRTGDIVILHTAGPEKAK